METPEERREMFFQVGKTDKKNVNALNCELFNLARGIMESSADSKRDKAGKHHTGWQDVSKFIDYLTDNYKIERK